MAARAICHRPAGATHDPEVSQPSWSFALLMRRQDAVWQSDLQLLQANTAIKSLDNKQLGHYVGKVLVLALWHIAHGHRCYNSL